MLEIIINQPNFSHKSKAVGSGTITVRIAEIAFVDFVSTPSPFNLLINMPMSRVAPTKIKSIYEEGWSFGAILSLIYLV